MYVSIYACMLVGTNVSSNEQRLRTLTHTVVFIQKPCGEKHFEFSFLAVGLGTNVSSNEQRLRILSHTQLSSYTILMETNLLNLAFWRLDLELTFHQMNRGCVFSHSHTHTLSPYTIHLETSL